MTNELQEAYALIARDILDGMSIAVADQHLLPEYLGRKRNEVLAEVDKHVIHELGLSAERAAAQ